MSSMIERIYGWLWKIALSIPYGKTFLLIVNSYVWRGDPRAFVRFAPVTLYITRLASKIIFLLVACYLFIKLGRCYGIVKTEPLDSIDVALQLFPNVLGFGIGAYALLFTFPERFFENLEASKRNKNLRIGAQGLNAIMAFPLLAIAFVILGAAILKLLTLSQIAEDTLGLFFVLYGMLLTMELIAVLFVSARKVIRNVGTSKPNIPSSVQPQTPTQITTTDKSPSQDNAQ